MPNITAADICATSAPTTNMLNPYKKWERIGMDMPTNKWVYNIQLQELVTWVEEQPRHMWKHYDIPMESMKEVSINALMGQNYVFTEEMEAWFMLRWS